MEDNFSDTIKSLGELNFPAGLHGKIMRKLAFLQFRTPFLVVVSLLFLNLLFSGWQIWTRLADSDAINTFRILLSELGWNWQSSADIFEIAKNLFPLGLMLNFSIDVLLVIYLLYVVRSFQTLSVKQKQL